MQLLIYQVVTVQFMEEGVAQVVVLFLSFYNISTQQTLINKVLDGMAQSI